MAFTLLRAFAFAIALTPLAWAQTVDVIGGTQTTSSIRDAGRGNVVSVTTTVDLVEIQNNVTLAAGSGGNPPSTLLFVIFRDVASQWVLEFEHTVTGQGPTPGPGYVDSTTDWWSSGPISFTLQAGETYAIMMYWTDGGYRVNNQGGSQFPVSLSFGTAITGAINQNIYPWQPGGPVGTAATDVQTSTGLASHQRLFTQPPGPPPAELSINSISAPAVVAQGDQVTVQVTVDNPGGNTANLSGTTLSFTGTVDRGSEYTVTPDGGNPTSIAGGSSEVLTFTVDVALAASLETILIDADVTGTDAVSGASIADSGATTTATWTVVMSAGVPGTSPLTRALLALFMVAGILILLRR